MLLILASESTHYQKCVDGLLTGPSCVWWSGNGLSCPRLPARLWVSAVCPQTYRQVYFLSSFSLLSIAFSGFGYNAYWRDRDCSEYLTPFYIVRKGERCWLGSLPLYSYFIFCGICSHWLGKTIAPPFFNRPSLLPLPFFIVDRPSSFWSLLLRRGSRQQ